MVNLNNISIPDTSPTFIFSPFREVEDLSAGWKTFYSGSSDSVYDPSFQKANRGSGTSSHKTSMQGASVELSFQGTAIYLYGSGTEGAYSTSLDEGGATTGVPKDGLLASYQNLEYKTHKLVLSLTQSQSLSMSSALVTVGVGKTGATVQQTKVSAVNVNADGSSTLNGKDFSTSGSGVNTRGNNDVLAYPRVDTNVAGTSITYSFTSASALRVLGAVYHDHGAYSVSLSPPAGASTSQRTFNASSKWFASDTLIYWESGLDRTQTYTLTFTNGEEGKYLDVSSVELWDGQGGTDDLQGNTPSSTLVNGSPTVLPNTPTSADSSTNKGSPLSTGAIAGIAAGTGVLATIVAGILLFCCIRRRKSHKQVVKTSGKFKDKTPSPLTIEPFTYQPTPPTNPASPTIDLPFQDSPTRNRFDSFSGDGRSSYYPPGHTPFANPSRQSSTSSLVRPGFPNSNSGSVDSRTYLNAGASSSSMPFPSSPLAAGLGEKPDPALERVRTPTIRQELDAGPLPDPDPLEEILLPPNYNPEWESARNVPV